MVLTKSVLRSLLRSVAGSPLALKTVIGISLLFAWFSNKLEFRCE